MLGTILALFVRIISNPFANAFQKILARRHSAILINTYSYAVLSIFCLYPAIKLYSWDSYSINYWGYVLLAGFLCTTGTICLIKALECGEISVLGPINSYKCIVGLVLAAIMLGEIPNVAEIIGIILIIFGSWYIFDTIENGFKLSIFKRKDILLRFAALFLTGCEAVVLKKIILLSSISESFILWCFSGFLFSIPLLILFKIKPKRFSAKDIFYTLIIALGLGAMQFSTNFVFKHLEVGLSLALFQLSGIVSIFFGWKIFQEKKIKRKIIGALIMLVGSSFILIK